MTRYIVNRIVDANSIGCRPRTSFEILPADQSRRLLPGNLYRDFLCDSILICGCWPRIECNGTFWGTMYLAAGHCEEYGNLKRGARASNFYII